MENSKDHKAAAEPPLDCRVGRFNPARELGYPDFNEHGHALAAGPFTCPECGGHFFGSSISVKRTVDKGYCHDEHGIGCRFSWSRNDDHKYFAKSVPNAPGNKPPTTGND